MSSNSEQWHFRDVTVPRLGVETSDYPEVLVLNDLWSFSDETFYSVIQNYSAKQLHQVYALDGRAGLVDTSSRYTHSYPLGCTGKAAELTAIMNDAAGLYAYRRFQSFAATNMVPQLLGYEERCQFRNHCDNSIWKEGAWFRNDPLRDLTGILYLSEPVDYVTGPNQYSGGELTFQNIVNSDGDCMTLRPRKGSMVIFPSSPAYQHQVSTITAGYRLAVVNWWAIQP